PGVSGPARRQPPEERRAGGRTSPAARARRGRGGAWARRRRAEAQHRLQHQVEAGERSGRVKVSPRAFRTPEALRAWLEKHGAKADELLLRCYKIHARGKGITYKVALDEALCFGWIDGV